MKIVVNTVQKYEVMESIESGTGLPETSSMMNILRQHRLQS